MHQTVRPELRETRLAPLRGRDGSDLPLESLLTQAVYYYVTDRAAQRVAWNYPRFRHDGPQDSRAVGFELSVDSDVWATFAQEADAQNVPVGHLLEHAALYLAADLDSGRAAERILETL